MGNGCIQILFQQYAAGVQASRDFAGEAARLSAALQQREQDLQYTGKHSPVPHHMQCCIAQPALLQRRDGYCNMPTQGHVSLVVIGANVNATTKYCAYLFS